MRQDPILKILFEIDQKQLQLERLKYGVYKNIANINRFEDEFDK